MSILLDTPPNVDRARRNTNWRGKDEVYFVIQRGGVAVPVQVTWDGPKDQHERALESFYERHPHAGEAVFVTAESFGQVVGAWGE